MKYLMRDAVAKASDNVALEKDRRDIMSALAVARDYCQGNELEQCRLYINAVKALARFLGYRNALRERVAWGKSALEMAEIAGDDSSIAELCASIIAWPLLQLGEYRDAEYYCLEGLKAAERCDDPQVMHMWAGNACRSLSGISRDANDGLKAQHWAEEAARHGRHCEDEALMRGARMDSGYAAMLLGNFEEAELLFFSLLEEEGRGKNEERIGNRSIDVALAVMNQALRSGNAVERTRRCDYARANIERSLRIGESIKHTVLVGECEIAMATLARIQGDESEYQRLMVHARRRFEELGIRRKGRAEQFVTFS
jgi:hypothetical protein